MGVLLDVLVGTLDSLRAETAGRLRTTKSFAPQTSVRVLRTKARSSEDGDLRKRTIRLPLFFFFFLN